MDDEALQNFYSEQLGLQEGLENKQTHTRMCVDCEDRTTGQRVNQTREEPEFSTFEFKEHLNRLSPHKTLETSGI